MSQNEVKMLKISQKFKYASTFNSCISFPMGFGEKTFGDKLLRVMNFRKVTSVQLSGYGWFSIILLKHFRGSFFSKMIIQTCWDMFGVICVRFGWAEMGFSICKETYDSCLILRF